MVCVSSPHLSCEKEINKPSPPASVSELGRALKKYPNCCFVNYLITGLIQGFLAGLSFLSTVSRICNDLLSSLKEVVNKLLTWEVEKGHMTLPLFSVGLWTCTLLDTVE